MRPAQNYCVRLRFTETAELLSPRFILIQLFKKTPVNRYSALDAESSGFKFRYVTVFNNAGPRVGARCDYVLFLEKS